MGFKKRATNHYEKAMRQRSHIFKLSESTPTEVHHPLLKSVLVSVKQQERIRSG